MKQKRGRPPKYLGLSAAARVIEQTLGVKCAPSSLLFHLRKGRLRAAVKGRDPWKLRPDVLVQQYPLEVTNRARSGPTAPPPSAHEQRSGWRSAAVQQVATETAAQLDRDAPPAVHQHLNTARAWAELEKARKLQAERLAGESVYLHRSEVQPAWDAVIAAVTARVLAVADQVAAQQPDLDQCVVECIERECQDALAKAFGAPGFPGAV